ncbi:sensor histidine kinase [Haloprofundus halophilus]|uniref:sensor histidine kinase n=1 Tax=Haloprofundus halophilus TaxID=2283527 RepID=UPI000E442E50|nr:HAMP domain-containing sensor histidine kinase [Haloprofundus halophilus]
MTEPVAQTGAGRRRVVVLGRGEFADELVETLRDSAVTAAHATEAAAALSALSDGPVDCFVVVADGSLPTPASELFSLARSRTTAPGLYVSDETAALPPAVEQVPADTTHATTRVRRALLDSAVDDVPASTTTDSVGAYGSTVSHELGNQLMKLDFAADSASDGDEARRLDRVLSRLRRLADEAEAVGRGTAAPETVELDAVAADAWDRVEASDADLVVEADRSLEADPLLLVLFFENVFRNAVRHGGRDVTVRVETTPRGFAVADDGPGFPEDARLFEWGHTTGNGSGTGLGIVARIADAHDWTVTAYNDGGAVLDVRTE